MREIRTSGSEGGGIEANRFSLPYQGFRVSALSLGPRLRACNPIGVRSSEGQIGVWMRKNAGHVIPGKAGIYRAASL
jgi:hypothetical protein